MSGIINKLTHRHQHDQAAPVGTGGLNQTTLPVQQTNMQQTNMQQPIMTTGQTNQLPTQTTHNLAPIVQETVRQDRVVEVQPVVHREVDKNIVHHIEKHIQEAPAPNMGGVIERQPIIQQQMHTNVVNEIQPIIHRERVVPVVERAEQHLSQHIVEPTVHTHEVVYERSNTYQGQQFAGQQGLQQFGGQQGYQQGGNYQGLNFPHTGAMSHPTYGYQKLPHNQKAQRFELKAAEWERRGNMAKAQKNREKAQRYHARSQPGYVAPTRNQDYYSNRANLFDQKAQQYQQWGMAPQAQRYQGRSQRLRTKHGLPLAMGGMGGMGALGAMGGMQQGGLQQGGLQQGLQQGALQQGLQGLQQGGFQQGGLQGGVLQQGLQGLQQGGLQQQQGGLQQGGLPGLQHGALSGLQQGGLPGIQQQGQGGLQQGALQGGLQGLQQGGIQQGIQGMQQGALQGGLQQGGAGGLLNKPLYSANQDISQQGVHGYSAR